MKYITYASLLAVTFTATSCVCQRQYCENPDVVDETYVHRYGVEIPAQDWANRGKTGQVVSTLKNGVVVTKSYSAGVQEGETTHTFPHSDVTEKVVTYSQGTPVKETSAYMSGAPRSETVYQDGTKTVTTWYENGSPMSKETYNNERLVSGVYYNDKNQVDSSVESGQGNRNLRDAYNQISQTDTFQDGVLVSTTTYHSNGHPKEIIPYRNGLVDGEKKTFLPAGEPNTIEQWVVGKQNGLTVLFQNGEKIAEVPYVEGQKNGTERHYRDGMTVVEEINWVNDQKHGSSSVMIGSTTKTDWFFKGKPVSQSTYDQLMKPQTR